MDQSLPPKNFAFLAWRIDMRPVLSVGRGLALLAALTLVGCGGKGYELAPVTGKVTCQDKPVPGGTVILSLVADSDTKAPPATARVDEEGNFVLMTQGKPGAAIGKHRISFSMPEVEKEPSSGGDPEDEAERKAEQELAQKLAKFPCRRPAVQEFTVAAGENTLELKLSPGGKDED
jgi:hypothetical protein